MRDRNAARAVLQSEIYRGAHRSAGARAPGATGVAPRSAARDGAGARTARQASGGSSPVTMLALLGLLDLFKGG